MIKTKSKLGDALLEAGLINEEQLVNARESQQHKRMKLGKTLLQHGYIDELVLLEFIAKRLGIFYIDLPKEKLNPKFINLLPEIVARANKAIVLEADDKTATLAIADPEDIEIMGTLKQNLHPLNIQAFISKESDIIDACDMYYRKTDEINQFAVQLQKDNKEMFSTFDVDLTDIETDTSVIAKLIRKIFEDATQIGASDIHIEPEEGKIRIRMRVDGSLQEMLIEASDISSSITTRIKILADLDISEKRLPQDGRFKFTANGKNIDVRVSTMPLAHGESIVMRLQDQSSGFRALDDLGMPVDMLKRYKYIISRENGIVLVTGPTGSGKTTTLYSSIKELNKESLKIITAEDPIEYRMERVNQIQLNEKIGLTFSSILRTALRQDPDILLVGEIRDRDTVDISLSAAITGHLVLSTLHTNDSVSSITRLMDMGAKEFLVGEAINGVLAQRLVKQVCTNCKEQITIPDEKIEWLKRIAKHDNIQNKFFQGKGCSVCNQTGVKGRLPVFELLEMTRELKAILKSDKPNKRDLLDAEVNKNKIFTTLDQHALELAQQGMTPVDEVFRLTGISPIQ